jgi:hypothetical protein
VWLVVCNVSEVMNSRDSQDEVNTGTCTHHISAAPCLVILKVSVSFPIEYRLFQWQFSNASLNPFHAVKEIFCSETISSLLYISILVRGVISRNFEIRGLTGCDAV